MKFLRRFCRYIFLSDDVTQNMAISLEVREDIEALKTLSVREL